MDEIILTPEQKAEAQRIEDNLRAAATVEIRRKARLSAFSISLRVSALEQQTFHGTPGPAHHIVESTIPDPRYSQTDAASR